MKLAPAWLMGYRRAWLVPDVIAGVIVWSVVVPQAVAYAQIAGLPPETGLVAAPGAMIAYAFLGSSRTLIVSATTATSALSASAVGLLAHGDTERFAVLSAALAIVTAVVLVLGGVLGLGSLSDFVSKPVMGGFLFGLGLTIILARRRSCSACRPAAASSSTSSATSPAISTTSIGGRPRRAPRAWWRWSRSAGSRPSCRAR